MPFHEVNDGGTVRRDERQGGVFDRIAVLPRDEFDAARPFVHLGEAELPQPRRKLPRRRVVEEGGKGAAKDSDNRVAGGKERLGHHDVVRDHLRVLGTVAQAVAAADAAVEHYLRVAFLDLDGLDGAASYAGVAFAALVRDGYDGVHGVSFLSDMTYEAGLYSIREKCATVGTLQPKKGQKKP